MRSALMILLTMCFAVPALAGPPANGTYKSTDLGGAMDVGRYTEFWPTGTALSIGNTVNEQSWDGMNLGAQWWWFCPYQIAAPTLLFDGVVSGNGQKIWRLNYLGGTCWLDGAGPWAGGDAAYMANIDAWSAVVTQSFSGGVLVGEVRTVNAQATFIGYNATCTNLQLSNTEKFGDTFSGTLPAGFPDFWDYTSCIPAGTTGPGEWGSVGGITFTVTGCDVIPVEEKTWGGIKRLYMD